MTDHSSTYTRWMMARLYDGAQRAYSALPYRLSPSGRAFPAWHYFIEVTRRCNLRCRMCQYISYLEQVPGSQQKSGELTTDEWKGVLDQVGRLSFITFTGGEPLVREDFLDLLTYASSRLRTHLVSNATLLKEPVAEALVALAPRRTGGRGFNFLGVSLEGPAERHDEIRQQAGAFERAAAGLRLLRAYREKAGKACPMIHITTVLQQANVDILESMPEIAVNLGADVLNLVTETRMHDLPGLGERPPGVWRSEDVAWPHIERTALGQALEKTEVAARKHGIELRLPRMPREELLNYYDGGVNIRDYTCRSPWNTLIIGRTGDVYPCWLVRLGNVREHSLKEMWNGQKAKNFRQSCRTRLFPVCPGCCFIEHKGK